MNKLLCLALLLLAAAAVAQESKPPDELEPGVDTSASSSAPVAPPAAAPSKDSPAVPAGAAGTSATTQPQGTPATSRSTPAAANKPAARPAPRGNARDRLDLDSTQITGNRELPKVLYIVPWRSAELGDLVGRPVNSLLDEVLEPVDRDVFRRQNRYFEALQPNAAPPASSPEK
ncbi:MAG TPA: hypothetical protein VFO82_15965 [Steroidobacteraceae bacterium]|nr:hypothetical protein [Steroidobacteraceae bacterium]